MGATIYNSFVSISLFIRKVNKINNVLRDLLLKITGKKPNMRKILLNCFVKS